MQMVGEKRLLRHRSRAYYWRKCKSYWRKCKRERGKTNIDSLPDELLLEILARLPADDLHYKARVVCRRWCHLIDSDYFIKTQLHRCTYGLLFCWGDHATFVTATQGRIETSEISYKAPPHTKLRSSCNGLVLHQQRGMPVATVTNPVTRQQFVLPPLSGKKMVCAGCCCIGYAADSMEYKLAARFETTDTRLAVLGILSVGRDKRWRRVGVEHLPLEARGLHFIFPLATNGSFIIWPDIYSGRYLKLDVETEILTAHPSPVPEACLVETYYYLSTGRSLSLLVVHKHKRYLMELWEMKAESGEWRKVVGDIKLGALQRWLQHFCNGGSGSLMPLGWVRYPEVLALRSYDCVNSCIFFNLNTQQISSMKMPRGGCLFPLAHKKSLTWFWP